MLTGVQDVYLNVADMPRAVAFYRDVLGLTVGDSDAYWTSLDCGGQRIGLHGTGGAAVPAIPHDAHGPHCGAVLTFGTDDIEAEVARLTDTGVRFLAPIDHQPWGSIAVFADPDGNLLKLMQPPKGHAS